MRFDDAFPERMASAPKAPGQPDFPATVLTQLRRQQLRDLATAFDVQIKADGTKDEILPAMIAAEANGIFRQPPKYQEYLVKASRSADQAPLMDWHPPAPPEPEAPKVEAPVAKAPSPISMGHLPPPPPEQKPMVPPARRGRKPRQPTEFTKLQDMCKQHDINCWGMGRDEMKAILMQKGLWRE